MTYSKLAPRNWFGGRVLMPFEMYITLRRLYFGQQFINRPRPTTLAEEKESDEHYQLKSFLNVIADSGVVETYLITKTEMQMLQDSELKVIYDQICQVKEPDRPNNEEWIDDRFKEMQEWEKEKANKIKEVFQWQKIEQAKRQPR